ncbi:hypothetical protein NF212_25315 (plasmid) [Parasalinivibrio latis]|uniref:hypothetical protein n=1 Tax=Parasalinivibrio latis TaxID=2952610 RepID=UPI0030E2D367
MLCPFYDYPTLPHGLGVVCKDGAPIYSFAKLSAPSMRKGLVRNRARLKDRKRTRMPFGHDGAGYWCAKRTVVYPAFTVMAGECIRVSESG